MIKLPELKALAKQNNLHYTCLNKDEIIALLIDNNIIITPADLLKSKIVEKEPAAVKHETNQGRYEHLKGIRNHPKTVEIFDRQTGETSVFTSTYKVRRAFGVNPRWIKDGKIWKERYMIKVVDGK